MVVFGVGINVRAVGVRNQEWLLEFWLFREVNATVLYCERETVRRWAGGMGGSQTLT